MPENNINKDGIYSAASDYISKHGKNKDKLVQFLIGTFQISQGEALELAEQAIAGFEIGTAVATSLSSGASTDSVIKELEKSGMDHDTAKDIVMNISVSVKKAKTGRWKKEFLYAGVCVLIAIILGAIFTNTLFYGLFLVGGYYFIIGIYHFIKSTKNKTSANESNKSV